MNQFLDLRTMSERIAVAADHAGYEYKTKIVAYLREKGYDVTDFGVESTESADYPDYAARAAKAVSSGDARWGVIVCGSGIGVSIVADKFKGVRAANCLNPEMATLAREHNDANVLTLGQRLVEWELVPEIIDTFLNTPTSDQERHRRRVEKIHEVSGL